MAGLLVSVRSAEEARAALLGGADVIDIKEPDRGPLGRADPSVWRAVRAALPREAIVSVALGELADWRHSPPPIPDDFSGIRYRKLGLACAGPRWADDWRELRITLGGGTAWVAVVYADWIEADAPAPDDVLREAISAGCAGILVDTWDKSASSPLNLLPSALLRTGTQPLGGSLLPSGPLPPCGGGLGWGVPSGVADPEPLATSDGTFSGAPFVYSREETGADRIAECPEISAPPFRGTLRSAPATREDHRLPSDFDSPHDWSWPRWISRARATGLFVVLAGGLDEAAIRRLSPLEPDLFAVRGAACVGGVRGGHIDPERVAQLATAAHASLLRS